MLLSVSAVLLCAKGSLKTNPARFRLPQPAALGSLKTHQPTRKPMMKYRDLREFIQMLEAKGSLKRNETTAPRKSA